MEGGCLVSLPPGADRDVGASQGVTTSAEYSQGPTEHLLGPVSEGFPFFPIEHGGSSLHHIDLEVDPYPKPSWRQLGLSEMKRVGLDVPIIRGGLYVPL